MTCYVGVEQAMNRNTLTLKPIVNAFNRMTLVRTKSDLCGMGRSNDQNTIEESDYNRRTCRTWSDLSMSLFLIGSQSLY